MLQASTTLGLAQVGKWENTWLFLREKNYVAFWILPNSSHAFPHFLTKLASIMFGYNFTNKFIPIPP
jgi:hypothetical protein